MAPARSAARRSARKPSPPSASSAARTTLCSPCPSPISSRWSPPINPTRHRTSLYDAALNAKERPTLDESLKRELNPMTLALVLALQRNGGQILDVRDPNDFAAAHLIGSINIGLGGQYATWTGTVLNRERPIVIIAEPGRENEAAVRLGRIGFDNIVGYLADGLLSLASRPDLTVSTERISPSLAAERLASSDSHGPLAVDVRAPGEYQQKSLHGSMNVPLNHLVERARELPKDRPLPRFLRGRLSLLDRCQSPAAAGLHRQRDRRRNCSLGNRASSGGLVKPHGIGLGSARNRRLDSLRRTLGAFARRGHAPLPNHQRTAIHIHPTGKLQFPRTSRGDLHHHRLPRGKGLANSQFRKNN